MPILTCKIVLIIPSFPSILYDMLSTRWLCFTLFNAVHAIVWVNYYMEHMPFPSIPNSFPTNYKFISPHC
jgi:hypothetical protein